MIGLALLVAAAQQCDLPPGWDAVAARHTPYVIFGETHGTAEAPAFVGRVACELARRHETLLVAVEQDSTDDAAFQVIWDMPDPGFADALARAPGWKGRQDGVASRAMAELLMRLHRLRGAGSTIDVVLFNGARDATQRARFAAQPGQGPHEAAQAENIRLAAARKAYNHVLVLTGNLHARKGPVTRGDLTYSPMAMQLAPAGRTTSLRMVSGAGTMWNCVLKPGISFRPGAPIRSDMLDCGNHPAAAMADLGQPAFVRLGSVPGVQPDEVYDGFVWLGPITGSPPAYPDEPQVEPRPFPAAVNP